MSEGRNEQGGERPARRPPLDRRETARRVFMLVLGALLAAFALLNFGRVQVNWILGTWDTPLILVIVISAAIGAVLDRVLVVRRRRRERR